jgi:hypothetical protein
MLQRMRHRRLVLGVVGVVSAVSVLLAISLAALDGRDEDGDAVASIDDVRGTYQGVGVGDDAASVRRVFGQSPFAAMDEPLTPTNADFVDVGGPTVVSPPCKPATRRPGGRSRIALLRYDDASFLFCNGTVFALMVTASDARTTSGLGVGDELEKAQSLYADLTCGEAPSGDAGHYSYCAGVTASTRSGERLHVWFGEDPVASITVSTTRYDGYER